LQLANKKVPICRAYHTALHWGRQFNSIVGTSAVYDYILQIWVVLFQHRQDGLLDVLPLVVAWGNDGYFGVMGH